MPAAAAHRSRSLLERKRELVVLRDALDAAREGSGRFVAICGTAGIGKSALLEAVERAARARGVSVLRARGVELEAALPFGVAMQLFERPLAALASADRDAAFARAAAPARALFGEPAADARGELALIHAVYWLAANLAERGPLVLAIDDAHWADGATLAWLHYLAHRVADLPLLVVAALRKHEPGADDALLTLPRHEAAIRVTPAPLSPGAVAQLVRTAVDDADDAFCSACATATNGNPFLLRELLATVVHAGLEPDADAVAGLGPEEVGRSVLRRVAHLGPEAVALARAVAVLGHDADAHRVAQLAELPVADVAELSDALAQADIFAAGGPPAFALPLLGVGVYDDIPSGARAALHRRAAGLLAGDGAPHGRVAAHLVHAHPAGERWAVDALRAAAVDAARRGAPAEAATLLRRALAEPPAADERQGLLEALAAAEVAAGDERALETFAQALARVSDGRRRAELVAAQARYLEAIGRPREAAAALDKALATLEDGDRDIAAMLQATWVSVSRADTAMRAEASERLAAVVSAVGDRPSLAERNVLAHLAREEVFAGEPRAHAVRLAQTAWADGALLEEETSGGGAWIAALSALGWADHLDEYERGFLAGLDDARRRGSVLAFATCSYALMFSRYYGGRLADAVADAEQALAGERDGWREYIPACRAQAVWALVDRGALEQAEAVLAPALQNPAWRSYPGWGMVLEARGRVALVRGRAADALEDFLAAGEELERARLLNPAILPWRAHAAEAAARLRRGEQARALADAEVAAAERFGAPRPLGMALRAAGIARGGDEGVALLGEAVRVLADSPSPLEHARALLDHGAALRRLGHSRDARAPLREALDLAHRSGALALAQRAHEELLVAGGRPRRPATSGAAALTPGERRVAQMAAAGMTNREIAQDLFVTVKAVQWHLGNAYRKLGIASRDALPEALGPPSQG